MATLLCQDLAHDPRLFDPRQPDVEPAEWVRQPLVVDAQAVQDRRVEIANMYRVRGDVVGEVIGPTVLHAALHSPAGEPDGEATAVMVPARARIAVVTLAVRS